MKGRNVMKYKITSKYGNFENFRNHSHTGIDFKMNEGEPLKSIQDGIIEKVVDYGSQNIGKGVLVKFEDGRTAIYGHMSDITVQQGQYVSAGDLIGYSGNTGFSTGAHLHFGIKENGDFLDPSPYIDKIQHMNDVIQHQTTKVNFFDSMQQHMNVLTDMVKDSAVNLVHFAISTDYTPFIQFFENILQFVFFNI
jgi:hypothetical protein